VSSSERLSAYLDGELAPDERENLEIELARAPRLRAELNALKLLSNELRVDETDRAAAERIGARLRRRRLRRALWPALPVAAALLLTVVLLRPPPAQAPTLTGDDLLHQYTDAVSALVAEPDGLRQ
jgi:anti-sigma factor RsiW